MIYRLAQIAQELDDQGLNNEAAALDGAINDLAPPTQPKGMEIPAEQTVEAPTESIMDVLVFRSITD